MPKILDSSAVLALLLEERGSDKVREALGDAAISSVNAAEVLRVLVKSGASAPQAARVLARLHLSVVPFDEKDLAGVAEITALAPELSLGDCACIALGARTGSEILTADRAWTRADLGAAITQIR